MEIGAASPRTDELGANPDLIKPPCQEALLQTVERIEAYWIGRNRPAVARTAA